MDDVAVAVLARVQTVIMALKAALEKVDEASLEWDLETALACALAAEAQCKRRLSL